MGDYLRHDREVEALFSSLLEDIVLLKKKLSVIEDNLSLSSSSQHTLSSRASNSHFLPPLFLDKTEKSLHDLAFAIKTLEYGQGLTFPVILYTELLEAKSVVKSLKKQLLTHSAQVSKVRDTSLDDTSLYPLKDLTSVFSGTSGVTRHSPSSPLFSPLFSSLFFSDDTSDMSRHSACHLPVYRLKSDVSRHSTLNRSSASKMPLPSKSRFFDPFLTLQKSDFVDNKHSKNLSLEVYDSKTTSVDKVLFKVTESDRQKSIKGQNNSSLPLSEKYPFLPPSPTPLPPSFTGTVQGPSPLPLEVYPLDPSLSPSFDASKPLPESKKTPFIENKVPAKSEDKPFPPAQSVPKAPIFNTDGLNLTEKQLLSILYNSDKPLSYGELAKALGLNYSTVKNKICFLNRKGYHISSHLNERREKEFFLEEGMRIKVSGR